MSFPAALTNAVDGVTEIVAAHLNNLEAKVGIDNSTVPTSLDYLLKNAASIEPGHKHNKLWAEDGSLAALTIDATGYLSVPGNRIYIPTTSGSLGQGFFIGTPATPFAAFQSLNLNGKTYSFFATNKYYTGSGWADMGLNRVGSYFQITDDYFTFFSFDTAVGSTNRFRIASGGNVGIGQANPGKKLDVNGYVRGVGIFNTLNSAPADEDLAAGECALWFDKTDGAAKLMIKAKQDDGTVKTGSVSLI